MKKTFSLSIAALLIMLSIPADACTSAIFTGKCTPDGRPLMWKHRDTGELNNKIVYYPVGGDVKYAFLGLVNVTSENEVWTGTNETGFSIMNTASYNLQEEKAKIEDQEGIVMYKALATCKTLADFEKMLDKWKRPIGVEANFGVIDAQGGAAYYEVNNTKWTKIDCNDPKIAPEGFVVYTNHSYTGRYDDGSGYIRYANAKQIIYDRWNKEGEFTPQWIFNNLSRSYYHSLLDLNLEFNPAAAPAGIFVDQDFIPRRSTSASIVVKGVTKGEDPNLTIMWTILGYPPCGVAIPMFVAAGKDQPSYMMEGGRGVCSLMCDQALERRDKVFHYHRNNGKNYFDVAKAIWYKNELAQFEEHNFAVTEEVMEKIYFDIDNTITVSDIKNIYSKLLTGDSVK